MKIRRGLAALLLALAMVIAYLPATANAESGSDPGNEDEIEYWFQEDRDILPGWDGSVDGRIHVYVRNEEHPDGDEWDIFADDIELKDGSNLFSDAHLDSDENPDSDQNNIWYYYRAKEAHEAQYGTATFTITYTDIDGVQQTYDVTVSVTNDVYHAEVRSANGSFIALPGTAVPLYADASHDYCRENGDDYEYGSTAEGLQYSWSLEDDEGLASLVQNSGDPSQALLTFDPQADPDEFLDSGVIVKVTVSDDPEGSGSPVEVAQNDRWFKVCSEYTEIWPAALDRGLGVGASIEDQPFEVREYSANGTAGEGFNDDHYKTISGVIWRWNDVDPNCLLITDEDGNEVNAGEDASGDTFTIKRLREWGSSFRLEATWQNGDGWCEQFYQLDGIDCRVEDTEHDQDVYTDAASAPSVRFDTRLGDNWTDRIDAVVTVGTWNDREEDWEKIYENGLLKKYYDVEETDDSITVTLDDSFFRSIEDNTDIRITAELYLKDAERTDENRISDTDSWLHIKPARIEYEMYEDRELLASYDGFDIDRYGRVRVENGDHPDGEDLDYEITAVEMIEETPASPGKKVLRYIRKDYENDDETSDSYWWHIESANAGTARIRVTYNEPAELGGETGKTYDFTVTVSEDVYELWVDSVDGVDRGLPGDTITLKANAVHRTRKGETTEGFRYEWEIVEGSEFADISQAGSDSPEAAVTLRLPSGYNTDRGYWEDIEVECRVYDGSDEVRARETKWLSLADSYASIFPERIADLEIGESVTVEPQLRTYPGSGGSEYDAAEGVSYEWYYDSNAVLVTDAKGDPVGNTDGDENYIGSTEAQKFTITRLREWDTDIWLNAYWSENGEDRNEERSYRLDWKDLQLYSRSHDYDISTDTPADEIPEAVFELDFGSGWQDRIDLVITAGLWDDENDDWDETFNVEEDYDYTVRTADNEVGIKITKDLLDRLSGAEGNICITAEAYRKGADRTEKNRIREDDLWLHLFESEATYFDRDHFDLLAGGDPMIIENPSMAWVRNTANPDGGFAEFAVNNVTITENEDGVIAVNKVDGGWEIVPLKEGDAEVAVSYTKLDGTPDVATLYIHVRDEVYYIDLTAEGNVREMAPGSTAALSAAVTLSTKDQTDQDISDRDDLSYEWSIVDGDEFAVISPEGNTATVRFKDIAGSDDNRYEEDVRVEVIVKRHYEEDDRDEEIGRREYRFRYMNEFYAINGADIDPGTHVGASVTVTPETRIYPSATGAAAGYDVVDDAEYRWEYDDEAVSITEKNGSYVIKRLKNVRTEIRLVAEWYDDEGYEQWTDCWNYLDNGVACDHEYGDASYVWADDSSKCTAKMVCAYDDSHAVEETAAAVRKETPAGCETDGKTVFTASFKNDAFKAQTKEVKIPALGHDFTKVDAKAATTSADGNIEYWKCGRCGKLFKDAAGKSEISLKDTVIPQIADTSADENKHAAHTWDAGKVTKAAGCTEAGAKTLTCTECGETKTEAIAALGHDLTKVSAKAATTAAEGNIEYWKCSRCGKLFKDSAGTTEITAADTVIAKIAAPGSDPKQKGADGTALGKGASAAAAEKAITSLKNDNDPAGSAFAPLMLKSTVQTKNSIKLNWAKVKGAKKYVIYGNACGKKNKYQKIATANKNTYTIKKIQKKALKKGTYHKIMVVALDSKNNVVSTSKVIHVTTKGGKVGNHKSVTVSKSILTKAKSLKKGKSLKLGAKAVAASKSLKVQNHGAVRYESSNPKVATVNKSGKLTAKKKGKCKVYAYAQNGVVKVINVVVK